MAVFLSFFCVVYFPVLLNFILATRATRVNFRFSTPPRSTGAIAVFFSFFRVAFSIVAQFFFWRIDEVGGEERSGIPIKFPSKRPLCA